MFESIADKFRPEEIEEQGLVENQQSKFTHMTPKTEYIVYLSSTGGESKQTHIRVTQKYSLFEWQSTFTAENIVEIARKTGNQLGYQEFVGLLRKALSQKEIDCYVDILTTEDLESLKNRKNGTVPPNKRAGISNSSKRYIILTHMAKETKFHYPLSLAPKKSEIGPDGLKEIYNSLRKELEAARNSALNDTQKSQSFSISYNDPKHKNNPFGQSKVKEIDQHRSENEILKSKLARLEEQVEKRKANIEIEAAIQRVRTLKQSIETENMELADWKYRIEEQEETHADMKKQLAQLHKKICTFLQSEKQLTAKKRGEQVNKQLVQVRNVTNRNNKEIQRLKKEVETSKAKVKELEVKAKKLASEKQVIQKGRRGPYSSSGSVRSYGSYSSKRSTGGYSSVSKPRSNYSYNSYGYGRK